MLELIKKCVASINVSKTLKQVFKNVLLYLN